MSRIQKLTPAGLHILLSLTEGPAHGLGIVELVEIRSSGEVTLGPGLLYGTLKRLMSEALLREPDETPPGTDPRRRYYEITREGQDALRSELERMAILVGLGREKRILGRG